jgi:uncharacterized RDD family membrane protein YckC
MPNLHVETGQNVIIKQDLANVGERIGAQLIDYVIIFTYFIFITIIAENTFKWSNKDVFMVIALIPVFFYSFLSETFMQGQSLGKKALKIQVVKVDGSQASIGSYLIRWMFRIIDVNFLYGIVAIITISVNGKGQRLGDIVAKTSVISLKRKKKIEDTIYVDVPEDYKLTYPEVEFLSDEDIKTIKDVIKQYKKDVTAPIANSMLKKTNEAVKRKMGIETKEVPLIFLQTIIKDYNHIYKNSLK